MWRRLVPVRADDLRLPSRLDPNKLDRYVPALWIRPKQQPRYPASKLKPVIREATTLFNRFKAGEKNLTYVEPLVDVRSSFVGGEDAGGVGTAGVEDLVAGFVVDPDGA
jgi:hypothetical protein